MMLKVAATAVAWVLTMERSSSLLNPRAVNNRHRLAFRVKPVILFMSEGGETESTRAVINDDEEELKKSEGGSSISVSRGKAKNSLQKLLARQKLEVLETERLLEKFENEHEDITKLNGDMSGNNSSSTLSFAASLVSGFDYGFQSRSEGSVFTQLKGGSPGFHGPPGNIFSLGSQQFVRNLKAIVGEYSDEENIALSIKQKELQGKLRSLTLNSTAIWEREGPIQAPFLIKIPYVVLCYFLDIVFENRYVPSRFFFLETVARMPYFSYITMLHLYETLGFWRRSADIKRVHFAEEINEFRHLLIMESLGGDQPWWVRFLAQHSAIAYYVVLCLLWAISPTLSYKFSELLETHAVHTYSQFLDENEDLLRELPPSLAAIEYYSFGASDPFYAEFQTSALARGEEIRRPGEEMNSLYDVYSAIRDDEGDHVSTMQGCMDPNIAVNSPSIERRIVTGVALVALATYAVGTGGGFDFINNPTDIISSDTTTTTTTVEDLADAEGIAEGSAVLIDAGAAIVGGLAAFIRGVFGDVTGNTDQESLELGSEALKTEPLFEEFFRTLFEAVTRFL